MKVLYQNMKAGELKVEVESPEDLWYLSQIVEVDDRVSGVTLRKVKATEQATGERRRVFLAVVVEKTEFTESAFRPTGKIVDGPEDVPRGSYHTFNITPNDVITITKEHWYSYQLERLKEAEQKKAKILVCVFDREDALFALITRSGFSILSKVHGDVQKKGFDESVKGDFFAQIVRQLGEYDKRYGLDHIIVASPAFWKDEFMKSLKDPSLKRKITTATCSSVSEAGVNEVLRREELHAALKEDRVARETKAVERLMVAIATQGAFAYGLDTVEGAAMAGAVDTLLVTDALVKRLREEDDFARLDAIMRIVDSQRGVVLLISAAHDAGKKLEGIGGVGALLRYKFSYD